MKNDLHDSIEERLQPGRGLAIGLLFALIGWTCIALIVWGLVKVFS